MVYTHDVRRMHIVFLNRLQVTVDSSVTAKQLNLYSCNKQVFFVLSVCDRTDSIQFVDNIFSLSRPGIGATLIYMGAEAIVFFALTLLVEVCVYRMRNGTGGQ